MTDYVNEFKSHLMVEIKYLRQESKEIDQNITVIKFIEP